jgi:hypothetical protein
MKVIEQNLDKLVLRYQNSWWQSLLIGIIFILGGLFFWLFSLVLIEQAKSGWILLCGMGTIFIFAGIFWAIKCPKVNTFTFDKSQNSVFWERRTLLSQSTQKSLEFPINSIAGIEIASFDDTDVTTYYPQLILKQVYWRIFLNSDGKYQSAVTIAKIVAEFLNVTYFADESKAPIPIWRQKTLANTIPYQFGWKYVEEEIDRLRQYLSQHSEDAEVHQELGILLHFSSRRNREDAIMHLQKAESLFEVGQELDRATLTKTIKLLVSWN